MPILYNIFLIADLIGVNCNIFYPELHIIGMIAYFISAHRLQ